MMFAGFDFGTSGARTIVIDPDQRVQFEARVPYAIQEERTWRPALYSLIRQIPPTLRQSLQAIAIDGTSGTFVGCDRSGNITVPPILYNDPRGRAIPSDCSSPLLPLASTLAKLVYLQERGEWQSDWYLVHHCDRVAYFLHGLLDVTDWHNALKLGYDPEALAYLPIGADLQLRLPRVVPPGTPLAPILPAVAQELGINPDCVICSGTTDSNSAFLAAVGYDFQLGTGVTSLGSSLTVKLLSQAPIWDRQYGIYSHRWQDLWLVGGASNSGGAVLSHFFSPDRIEALSRQIDPAQPLHLNYYPLLQPGERFPVCDPAWEPRLTPRPDQDHLFLQGLLEGIAAIERLGYDRLRELGAPPITRLYTLGGGAANPVWTAIRQRYLDVPLAQPLHREAAYGSALLAHRSIRRAPE
jgi:sugar (pentulose or hexulose) kinase